VTNSDNTAWTRSDFMLERDHVLLQRRSRALWTGVGALLVCVLWGLFDSEQFFQSWLVAWMYWLGVSLGSMGLVLLNHLTGGRWGTILRRSFEAASRTVPLMAVLFVPVLLGMGSLYEWTHADIVAHDPILQHKAAYLNTTFFIIRAFVYFAAWIGISTALTRLSARQDLGGHNDELARSFHMLARIGIVVYVLTMTFASIDWVMSLEPHWFSHIYGVIFTGGQFLTALAFMIAVVVTFADSEPFSRVIIADRFHDMGKLMLAFIMLWAYFHLSQFLIIWAANLPEEVPWYIARISGGWQLVALLLVAGHFVMPFIVLLSRSVKRNHHQLAVVATAMLVMRYVDLYWFIGPAFSPGALAFHPLNILTMIAIGGLWYWYFTGQLEDRPVLAFNDPLLVEELKQ
jgi:hypothetical protein